MMNCVIAQLREQEELQYDVVEDVEVRAARSGKALPERAVEIRAGAWHASPSHVCMPAIAMIDPRSNRSLILMAASGRPLK